MELNLGWPEVAGRLLCAVVAAAVIGLNREEHGRAAGLRTTLLVCLASAFAMLLVNLLLGTKGKTTEMFATLDLMRLPLGILSGMGFIGAGAIVRRDSMVLGVTTAATLWFVTVMGLCFGAGEMALGWIALALGFGTLTGLKWTERQCKQDRSALLTAVVGSRSISEDEVARTFAGQGYRFRFTSTSYGENGMLREMSWEIRWRGKLDDPDLPDFLREFSRQFGLAKLDWRVVAGH